MLTESSFCTVTVEPVFEVFSTWHKRRSCLLSTSLESKGPETKTSKKLNGSWWVHLGWVVFETLIDISTSTHFSKAVTSLITATYRKAATRFGCCHCTSDNVTWIFRGQSYCVLSSTHRKSIHRQQQSTIFSQTVDIMVDKRSPTLKHNELLKADQNRQWKLSQYTCEACGLELQKKRTIPDQQGNWWTVNKTQ